MLDIMLLVLSVIFLIASIFCCLKTEKKFIHRLAFALTVLISVMLYLIFMISDYFTGEGIDYSVIQQLQFGFDGFNIFSYINLVISSVLISLAALTLVVLLFIWRVDVKSSSRKFTVAAIILVLLSLCSNPAIPDLIGLLDQQVAVQTTDSSFPDSGFADYYKVPNIVQSGDAKNFVFIYAESLEQGFLNESLFPNLTPGLNKIRSRSTYFDNVISLGSALTIVGIVSSQCGMPLFVPFNLKTVGDEGKFMPLARCLGDELKANGYSLSFYGGANTTFTSKGAFFSNHGFSEVRGSNNLEYAIADAEYVNRWGLYDDTLFDIAYARLDELLAGELDFGLFLLTLDTHDFGGLPSKKCKDVKYQDGTNPMLNTVHCTDWLLTDLITKIEDNPLADDVVIVLISDHISRTTTAIDKLNEAPRKMLFMVIEPGKDGSRNISRYGSTIDISSTILPFIGFKGDIGLGTDLAADNYNYSQVRYIQANYINWRNDIFKFWSFPNLKQDGITIDTEMHKVLIGDLDYGYPSLIVFDNDLDAELFFNMNDSGLKLSNYALSMNKSKSFIWIESCAIVSRTVNISTSEVGICIVAGKNGKYSLMQELLHTTHISPATLEQLKPD